MNFIDFNNTIISILLSLIKQRPRIANIII